MQEVADLLKALLQIAWFVLAAIVVWRLMPSLEKIAQNRNFTVKIAGQELSVQDTTEQISAQIKDLQNQVVELRRLSAGSQSDEAVIVEGGLAPTASASAPSYNPGILWVDDKPGGNALEVAQLRERGYEVKQVVSTNEALSELTRSSAYSLVISDMGRTEQDKYEPQAGLLLLKAMRGAGFNQPFIVYTGAGSARRNSSLIRENGGDGAVASPVSLLEWVVKHSRK